MPLMDAIKLALPLLAFDDVVPARFMPPVKDSNPLRLLLPCAAAAASKGGAGCRSSNRDDPKGEAAMRRLPLGRMPGDKPPLS